MSGIQQLDSARMLHFRTLEPAQQAEAIRRLSTMGQSDFTISRATGLSVEAVKIILGTQERS